MTDKGRRNQNNGWEIPESPTSIGGMCCGKEGPDGIDDAFAKVEGFGLGKTEDIVSGGFEVADAHLVVSIRRTNWPLVLGHLDDQLHRRAAEIHHVWPDGKLPLESQGISLHPLQAAPDACFLGTVLEFQQPVQGSIQH